jgi:hypothetical protein
VTGVDDVSIAHSDNVLIAELTGLNTRVARYVLRHLDADRTGQNPNTPDEHYAIADLLAYVSERMRMRGDLAAELQLIRPQLTGG